MKFLVDRCAGVRLAQWLREQGHDVLHLAGGQADPGDAELLARAVAEGRVLVTLDKDFGALVFAQGASHCGLVRLPDVPAAQRIALFAQILAAHETELSGRAIRSSATPLPDFHGKPVLWENGPMKTTLELPDELMRRVKMRAVQRHQKLKDAVAQLLEAGIAAEPPAPAADVPKPVRLKKHGPLTIAKIEAAIASGRD